MAEEFASEEGNGDLYDENDYDDEYDYDELDDYGGPESEVYYDLRFWLKRHVLSASPKQAATVTPSHNDTTTTEDVANDLELSPEQIEILKKEQVVIKHTKLTLFGMLQRELCLKRLVDDNGAELLDEKDAKAGIAEERMPKREQVRRSKSVDINPPKYPPVRRLSQPDLTYTNAHCVSIISLKGHTGMMDIVPSLLNFHPIIDDIVTFRESEENDQSLSLHGTQLPNYLQFLQASFMSLISLKDCLNSPSQPLEAGKHTPSVQYKDDKCTPLHCVVSPEPLQEGVTFHSVFGNSLDSLAERCYNECTNPLEQHDIIRKEIEKHGIIAHIPTQWLLLQYALEIFRDTYDSIIEFTHCVELSTMFYMEESQVKEALVYLHNMSIFLYFPDVLPELVFLRPQLVIEKLAQLMKTCKSLMKMKREAKKAGIFPRRMIKRFDFDGFQLQEGHVEYLMSRMFVIAKLPKYDEFFFPGVLDFATPSELPKYDNIEPLVITQKKNHVFPSSFFWALVFKLMSHDLFCINMAETVTQYRNAIMLHTTLGGTVALINSRHYLEVYYSGLTENCFQIRTIIEEEIPKIVTENKWRQSLKNFKYCFFCSMKNHENQAKHLCELNKKFDAITCCMDNSVVWITPEELGKKKEWVTDKIVYYRSEVPDIQKVHKILCSEPGAIQNKWVDLASALGVRPQRIDPFPNASMATMLHKVLDYWLNSSSKEERTWNVLIEAIRRDYISPAKANEIEKEIYFY